jgi:molybdate transport system substrate-binding protein
MRRSVNFIFAATVATTTLIAVDTPVSAAELKVMSAVASKVALDELIPLYEKISGNKVVAQYDSVAVVARKATAGETFDVAISNPKWMGGLVKDGIVLSDSETVIGVTVASLAYRRGTPKMG